jgi:hypothetical protein
MVRLGEDIVIVESDSGTIGIIGGREIGIGKRVVSLPSDGLPIAVRQFNTYVGDDGVSIPLPCGTRAFIASEPPNYLPTSWESGFPMSCQQGTPRTDGWKCSASCPINPGVGHICQRGEDNGWIDPYNINYCHHSDYASIWQGNADNNWHFKKWKYYCNPSCPWVTYKDMFTGATRHCPSTNNGKNYGPDTYRVQMRAGGTWTGSKTPSAGCVSQLQRVEVYLGAFDQAGHPAQDRWGCNGPRSVCPNYNGGAGVIKCAIGPDPADRFPVMRKPTGCRQPTYIDFSGWVIPGDTQSTSASCVLAKATEGAANRSNGEIRCVFSLPSGSTELTGQGDLRLPISPTNLEGTPLTATASIGINGGVSYDYTRYPSRQSKTGTACAFTQGRY